MRMNSDTGAKELFGCESDRRRNLLICMNCLRKNLLQATPATSEHTVLCSHGKKAT